MGLPFYESNYENENIEVVLLKVGRGFSEDQTMRTY